MLRMTIEGVGFDPLRQTVVVLKDWEGRKLLPIWIGAAEARSIALHLEGATPPRPLAHDLLMNCIQGGGGRITRVVINDLQDATFFATVDIDTPKGLVHIDARPSDAIALAVRAKCPVFVDGGALNALVDMSGDATGDEADDERAALDDESPLPGSASEYGLSALSDSPASDPTSSERPGDGDIDRFKRLVGDLDL